MVKHSSKRTEKTQKTDSEKPEIFVATAGQIARLFDVTERTVTGWAKDRSMPKLAHGKYVVRDVLSWWLENIYESPGEQTVEELKAAKIRYWNAKAKNEELRAGKEDAKLMPVEEIASEWTKRMAAVSSGLDMLSYRLPPLLEGKDQDGMRHAIDAEIWRMKDVFCRTGRFCGDETTTAIPG